MPQLHFYISELTAQKLQQQARMAGISMSSYVAELVQREVGDDWPPDFFETVVGGWIGDPLRRTDQGEWNERGQLRGMRE